MTDIRYRSQIPDQIALQSIFANGLAEQWRFVVSLPDLGNSASVAQSFDFSSGASFNSAAFTSNIQVPHAIAESVDIPTIQVDMDDRYGQGTSISVPRKWSYPNVTINFYEDSQYNVSKYLWAWKLLIADGDQLYNLPTVWKKDLAVLAFDSQNNYNPVMQVSFIECAPTTFIGGLSYGQNNGFLTVSSDFVVDDMEFAWTR